MSGQKRKLSLNYFVEPSTALEHPEINSKWMIYFKKVYYENFYL
jgi:hypothetical protein